MKWSAVGNATLASAIAKKRWQHMGGEIELGPGEVDALAAATEQVADIRKTRLLKGEPMVLFSVALVLESTGVSEALAKELVALVDFEEKQRPKTHSVIVSMLGVLNRPVV